MGDDDKPFGCNAPGCGMRFTNEDHLTVHCKKHEMSLSLNTENNNAKSSSATLFVDQTPTPTRFIRNCEEVGLFQELNPFEEQFRKHFEATKLGSMQGNDSLRGSSDTDILNTPSILPDDLQADTCDVLVSCHSSESQQHHMVVEEIVDESADGDDDDGGTINRIQLDSKKDQQINDEKEEEEICIISSSAISSVAFSTTVISPTVSNNCSPSLVHPTVVTQTQPAPVCFSGDSSETSAFPNESSPDTGESITISSNANSQFLTLPASAPMPLNASTQSGEVSAMGTNAMVQLILKLPDGRSVPLHIPAIPVLSSSAPATSLQGEPSSISTIRTQNSSNSHNNTSFAKLKLREVLTQGSFGDGKFNSSFKLSDEKRVLAFQEMFNLDSTSNDSDFNEKSNQPKRKRYEDQDPDEKRRRFLERNRAAATRCRQKRKKWIRSLESKADELSGMNEHLQNEVAMLRNEVAHLKSMLLAHKDCPVTQQQQKHMGSLGLPVGSTIVVNTCSNNNQMSTDEAIASSALTNLAGMESASAETMSPSAPVVLRTIMTHEQALALLTRSSQASLVKPGINSNN